MVLKRGQLGKQTALATVLLACRSEGDTMIKPIETWTKTFAKLGRRVHRIWRTEDTPTKEYRFSGFEILEERQLLSGSVDDPTGGSGDSAGDAADIGGPTGGDQLPDSYYGLGEFGNGLTLPEHWQSVLPAGYSWSSGNIFTYTPSGTEGTTTYTSYVTDADGDDTDPDSIVVSRYEYTLTIDWEGGVYTETIDGTLSRYVLASDDSSLRDQVFTSGVSSTIGSIYFESDLDYQFQQTYDQDQLVQVSMSIDETNDTTFSWNAFNYYHLDSTSTDTVTSDASFGVTGSSHGQNNASFQATITGSSISFTVNGSGSQESGSRDGAGTSEIVQTYSGTTTVESGDIDSGAEGSRKTLTLNGTVNKTFSSSYNFGGTGSISDAGSGVRRAAGTITKSSDGESTFVNDLTSSYDSVEVVHNVAIIGTEEADALGDVTSGSGFVVNLPDGDSINNTNRTTVHNTSIDKTSGGSSFASNHSIEYSLVGSHTSSPSPGETGGMFVSSDTDVDETTTSEVTTSIRKENPAGFSEKSISVNSSSHTTGYLDTTIDNKVTETLSTSGDESFLPVRVGNINTDGTIDLTSTGTSTQIITIESNQHVVAGGGVIAITRSGSGAGSDSDDGSNLEGSGGDDDSTLPPPGEGGVGEFNDYRKNTVTISLVTNERTMDTTDVEQAFSSDGTVTITDNSHGSIRVEYLTGSYIESKEERSHTPTETAIEGLIINQGVTSSSNETNKKEITGAKTNAYENQDLVTTLTPVTPSDEDTGSTTDGDVGASTGNLGGETSQEYDVTVQGTTVASSNGNLTGVITGSGDSSISHWSTEGTGSEAVYKTMQVSGDWTLNGNSNTTGQRTTTTTYLANEELTITYTGESSEELSTTKVVNSDSARGESSGDLPPGMIDPHTKPPVSDAEFDWVNGTFMANPDTIFDFNFDSDSVDNTTINNERDKFQGTFSIEKSTENASTEIQTDTFSASKYSYDLGLTPKATSSDSDGSGGEELSEPTVETGGDTSAEIAGYRDLYDVELSGTVEEIDLANITNTTLSSTTVTVKLSQTEGTHPGSEDYWLSQAANGVLPEWANRHLVRSAMVDKSVVVSGEVNTLVLDTSSTKFENGNAITTTSGLPPRPTTDDGMGDAGGMGGTGGTGGTGGADAPENEHPFAYLSSEMTVFHDAYDDLIGEADSVNGEIEDQFTGGDDGSGMGVPSGPGGGDTDESSGSAPVYTIVSDHKHIAHSQRVQELKFMDSLDMLQGYFSITNYTTDPSEGNDWSEKQSNFRIVNRNLTSTQSVDAYLDGLAAPVEEDTPTGTDAGSSGSSSATADSGGSGESSYTPTSDVIGKLRVQTDSSKMTDYQWKQTEKVHKVALDGTRHMTSQTKSAEFSHNREINHSVQDTDFKENSVIEVSKTNAKYEQRVWKVRSDGKSKLRGIIYHSDRDFYSTNEGGGWFATTKTTSYSITAGTYSTPTYSGQQQAAAAVTGHIHDDTTDQYTIDPTLTSNQTASRRTIVDTYETAYGNPVYHMIDGGYFEVVDLDQRIMLNRNKVGTTTYTFTMLETTTTPVNSTDPSKEWGAIVYIGEFKTYSFGNLTDEVEYHAIATTVGTRLMGFVTLVGGVAEVAAGVALTETGLGAPFGVVAIVHGIDTIYAGSTQLLGGGESRTLTAQLGSAAFMQGIAFMGANEITDQEREAAKSFGDAVDVVVGLADMGAGAVKAIAKMSKAAKAADTLTGVRSITNAADNLDEASRLKKAAESCTDGRCFIAGVPVATIAASQSGNLLLANSPSLWLPELELPKRSGLWTVEVAAVGGVILATIGMLKKEEPKSKRSSRPTRQSEETDFAPGQLVYC